MSWGSWLTRIGGYVAAPFTGGASVAITEPIAAAMEASGAIKDANQEQKLATEKANRISADIYNQQRADYDSQSGVPYRTLGSLMGLDIAPLGAPSMVREARPPGLYPGGQMSVPTPSATPGPWPSPLTPYNPPPTATLKDLQQFGRKRQSGSTYQKARA